MSLIQELGARLNAAGADLPLGEVVGALDKLRASAALLAWVRQQSANPLGVPELSGAVEHLEHAMAALHVAQDSVTGYLAAIGLGTAPPAPPGAAPPPAAVAPAPEPVAPQGSAAPRLRRWWAERVAYLTDGPVEPDEPESSTTSQELLRQVARRTGAGDREGLRKALEGAPAPVGLGLAALAPALLHRLATGLLGHDPGPADLPALTRTAREPVLALLPKLPPPLVDRLLAQVCRTPTTPEPTPPHPADSAVANGVLVGVLARRLGQEPEALFGREPGAR
jgi:hypothetical protein